MGGQIEGQIIAVTELSTPPPTPTMSPTPVPLTIEELLASPESPEITIIQDSRNEQHPSPQYSLEDESDTDTGNLEADEWTNTEVDQILDSVRPVSSMGPSPTPSNETNSDTNQQETPPNQRRVLDTPTNLDWARQTPSPVTTEDSPKN